MPLLYAIGYEVSMKYLGTPQTAQFSFTGEADQASSCSSNSSRKYKKSKPRLAAGLLGGLVAICTSSVYPPHLNFK